MNDLDDPDPDPVRWFDALGVCKCGRSATGKLMGPKNESYGKSCEPCARKRLNAAQKARDTYKARQA